MASDADIAILIKARDEASKVLDGVGKSSRGMAGEIDEAGKSAEKSGGMLAKLGPSAALGIGAAAAGIGVGVVAVKGFIDAASNMNETQSKSNTIFGENADAINQWASGSARDFGLSKQAALDNAASFGNMFTQLGIGTPIAADMSTQMVELAADFASFHNADITEVLAAQQAAFRGEYDAVQRFVPTINAANVEQKALAMTGKTLTSELTAQEKALATQALLMEGAGAAAGDFDRTSSGLANSTRTLSAMWADAQVKLGSLLLPAMTAVALFIVGTLIPGIESLITRAKPVFAAIAEVVRTEFAKFQQYYEESVKPALDNVIAGVEAVVAFIREHWPQIEQIVKPILDQVVLEVETAIALVMGVLDILIKLLAGDFAGAWQAAQDLVATAWAYIQGTVQNGVDLVIGLLSLLRDIGLAAMAALWDQVQAGFGALRDAVVGIVQDLVGQIVGAIEGMTGRVRDAINGMINLVNGAINRINSALTFTVSFPGFDPPGPGSIPGFSHTIDAGHIPTIPNMAMGGIVRATPGGRVVRVAEAGHDEAIVPLDGSGRMYGNHYGTVQIIAPNIRTTDDLMPGVDWGAA